MTCPQLHSVSVVELRLEGRFPSSEIMLLGRGAQWADRTEKNQPAVDGVFMGTDFMCGCHSFIQLSFTDVASVPGPLLGLELLGWLWLTVLEELLEKKIHTMTRLVERRQATSHKSPKGHHYISGIMGSCDMWFRPWKRRRFVCVCVTEMWELISLTHKCIMSP